uniref:Sepia n=1 Tax=Limnogonus franciscanus TaxID=913166 RepID=A0A5C1YS72_9HEMI|nr:sepia [Limnogonus franciscanus]
MAPKHLSVGSSDVPPEEGKLRLYSMRFCPYAQRVHLALNAKKIPYDVVYVNLKQKPEWFLERFPLSKVPALVVNNTDLYESLVIADYLDEAYPGEKIFSQDPLQKAKDRILIEMFNKVSGLFYKIAYAGPSPDPSLLPDLFDAFDFFENELKTRGTPFFSGSKPGGVDYMIWPWCERFEAVRILGGAQFRVPKDRFPKMFEWNKGMIEDEVVKSFFVTPEQHAKFMQSVVAGSPDYDNIL